MTSTPSDPNRPLLSMRGIRKSFGEVEVLKGIDFDARAGETHALCGENGAGKSTLMNILAGVVSPDAGEIEFDGAIHKAFPNAHAAQRLGIAIVYQERSLFGPLTVAENIFAGRLPVNRWSKVDRARLHRETDELLKEVAPEIRADAIVGDLRPSLQQMVEIAKALSIHARLVIFDEPTAALTETETARLFAVIGHLKARGVAMIYISHRLEEIFHLADRVTVLKDGSWQGTVPVAETNTEDLIRRMVGRDIEKSATGNVDPANPVLLDVRGLSDPPKLPGEKSLLREISFHVHAGEIVGFAGLAGAGRTETALALFGLRPKGTGEIHVAGERREIRSPSDAIAAGLGYVSEDRKESGLFLDMSVRRNVSVAALPMFGGWKFRDREEEAVADDFRSRLRIVCRDLEQDVWNLSGGNQQKVMLARWLLVNPTVLIVDEPTRGVDVGAKVDVHKLLRDFASQGKAALMISSELPEILAVSDRIYVMRAGRIAGELSRAQASEEAIMRLAAGSS